MAQRMVKRFRGVIRSHLSDVKVTIGQIQVWINKHGQDDPTPFSADDIVKLSAVRTMMIAKLAEQVAKH